MKGVFKCAMEDDERRSSSVKRSSLGMPPCIPNKYSRRLKRLSLGMHGGIPKLRRLSLLEYLLGMHGGIPKLERLTLLDVLSSSSIAHLKTPFIHNSS